MYRTDSDKIKNVKIVITEWKTAITGAASIYEARQCITLWVQEINEHIIIIILHGRPAWSLLNDDEDDWFSKWQSDNEGNINKTNVNTFKQKLLQWYWCSGIILH